MGYGTVKRDSEGYGTVRLGYGKAGECWAGVG